MQLPQEPELEDFYAVLEEYWGAATEDGYPEAVLDLDDTQVVLLPDDDGAAEEAVDPVDSDSGSDLDADPEPPQSCGAESAPSESGGLGAVNPFDARATVEARAHALRYFVQIIDNFVMISPNKTYYTYNRIK